MFDSLYFKCFTAFTDHFLPSWLIYHHLLSVSNVYIEHPKFVLNDIIHIKDYIIEEKKKKIWIFETWKSMLNIHYNHFGFLVIIIRVNFFKIRFCRCLCKPYRSPGFFLGWGGFTSCAFFIFNIPISPYLPSFLIVTGSVKYHFNFLVILA